VAPATLGLFVLGCDAGPETDASKGVGPPIQVVSSDVSGSHPLPADQSIHLSFDRLLLPESISRQSFLLSGSTPVPSYDPITRIVTLTPIAPLVVGQTYTLEIATPQSATDLTGLRAIDGATIDPKSSVIAFQAAAAIGTVSGLPLVDFCNDVTPILVNCTQATCHSGSLPPAGLDLSAADRVLATAIGRVAEGSNQGPSAQAQAPGLRFGLDMPIVDPGTAGSGDPANSWLIYKLLLAKWMPGSASMAGPFPVAWVPLSDGERAILASYVSGREMPFPTPARTDTGVSPLSVSQMETMSRWIAEGAIVPSACAASSSGG
jgi:hypothetical protein